MAICPVHAMREYLALRPAGMPDDFLFITTRGRPITTRDLTRTMRLAGSLVQLDVSRLTGHCFRIGGASFGAQCGLSELQLAEAGRWSSSAVRRYLRKPMSLLQLPVGDGLRQSP